MKKEDYWKILELKSKFNRIFYRYTAFENLISCVVLNSERKRHLMVIFLVGKLCTHLAGLSLNMQIFFISYLGGE